MMSLGNNYTVNYTAIRKERFHTERWKIFALRFVSFSSGGEKENRRREHDGAENSPEPI